MRTVPALALAVAIGAGSPSVYDYATAAKDSFINYQSVVRVDDTRGGHGSGVILGKNIIATAKHVATMGPRLVITDTNGKHYRVVKVVLSKYTDLAWLYVDTPFDGLTKAEINCNPVGVLEPLYIVGYPLDFTRSVYQNIAVGYYKDKDDKEHETLLLVTGVSLPGDSGGPVFNAAGQLIGLLVGEYLSGDGDTDVNIVIPTRDTGGLCKAYA